MVAMPTDKPKGRWRQLDMQRSLQGTNVAGYYLAKK